jgi:hypothetical protein
MKNIILSISIFCSTICLGQTSEELEFFNEVNLVRTNPQLYASFVRDYSTKTNFVDKERVVKFIQKELLPILDTMHPIPALKYDTILRKRMNEHNGIDTANKTANHDHDFLHKYNLGENIATGGTGSYSYRTTVINLLIDYGPGKPGHRDNILNKTYTKTAVRMAIMGSKPIPPKRYSAGYKHIFIQDFD